MLKRIATRKRVLGPKRFTKCRELAKLLGYQGREAEGEYAYHGIPAMARLLLTLSQESPAIKERFTAVSDVTRFCNDEEENSIVLRLPFVIPQQLNYDFLSDGDHLFAQASRRSEDPTLRRQYRPLAQLLSHVFAEARFREAVNLDDEDFFTCSGNRALTLSFRFRRMSWKATHAVFLIQPPTLTWLSSQGKLTADPDDDGYPGQISLEKNRAPWYEVPSKWAKEGGTSKDYRKWELYSTCLATLLPHGTSDVEFDQRGPLRT
ncbi:hypothetical protein AAVH_27968 [Aphelenchoides avenae]|nr:hypothetical protein AAVH_27968 [Aphelenchus avenae]